MSGILASFETPHSEDQQEADAKHATIFSDGTMVDLPPWLWFVGACVLGIPLCAYLNCYVERWRDRRTAVAAATAATTAAAAATTEKEAEEGASPP